MKIRDLLGSSTRAAGQGFYTSEDIGPKRKRTPEGFLICLDVPLGRTGVQMYSEKEIPLKGGPDGLIRVERTPEEVFRLETIASYEGKVIVDDHPMDEDASAEGWDVNPDNVDKYAAGHVQNVRRGEGVQDDLLLGDLFITKRSAIEAVLGGKREVSGGYNCEYEQTEPGRGRQVNILGNHVALVDHARCGTICSIGDSDMRTRDERTPARGNTKFELALAKVQIGRRNRDEKMIEEGMKEMGAAAKDEVTPGGDLPSPGETGGALEGNHVHIHMPGNVGNGKSAQVDDVDPAAGTGEGAAEIGGGGDANGRLSALETAVKQIAATLAKMVGGASEGGEDDGEEIDAEGRQGEMTGNEDADPEDDEGTEDSGEMIELDDPHPAATGNRGEGRVADNRVRGAKDRSRDGVRTRARDSKHLTDTFQTVVARAEILSPGVPIPTFDAKKQATFTLDSMCKLRRRTLERAWRTEDGKATIQKLFGGRDLPVAMQKMTCDSVRMLFNGAAELVSVSNNDGARGSGRTARTGDTKPTTNADINKKNAEFWGARTVK